MSTSFFNYKKSLLISLGILTLFWAPIQTQALKASLPLQAEKTGSNRITPEEWNRVAETINLITGTSTDSTNDSIGISQDDFDQLGSVIDRLYIKTDDTNVSIGKEALNGNTTGVENVAIGARALLWNNNTNFNTAVGANALLLSTSGTGNTALGRSALSGITTGRNNIGIGLNVAKRLTTGSNNILIGNDVDVGIGDKSNYLSIGETIFGNLVLIP